MRVRRTPRPGIDGGILRPFRSLLAAQVIGAVLGLLFWITVARLVPSHEVGVAAAAISAQTLLGIVTTLGLGTLLISELPRQPPERQRRLLVRSLLAVTVAGVSLAGLVALASPWFGANLREALGDPLGALTFVVGVATASAAVVTDESTLGLRRSHLQVGRNLLASGLRFPLTALLLLLGLRDSHVLQLCWVLPMLVSIPVVLWRLRLPRASRPQPTLRQDLATYAVPALHNQALNLSIAAGSQLVPVVAGLTLTSVVNAEFAVAWQIATFVFLPPYLLAIALFSHGANVPTEEFRRSMQTTLPASLALSLLLCLGAWTLGEPVLLVFGGGYAESSWRILALLVPAGLWMVFKDHLVALWRSQRRFSLATRLATGALVLEVTGACVGAVLGGATGLCLGWLAAAAVEVLVAIPWLREAFGGLRWQLPSARLLSRSESGRVSWQVAGATGLVGALAAVALVLSLGSGSGVPAPAAGGTRTAACAPSAEHPGPLIDLGVQAATGDPASPLLSEAQVARLVALADDAGASVVSTSASWRSLRPQEDGPYDFVGLDRVVDEAVGRGLQVRVLLGGMPTWAQDGIVVDSDWRPPLARAELRRWGSFVTDTMRHLRGRVDYVEVWDEPNNPQFWATGPDPVAFARLLRATGRAIRSVDPGVQVVSGGLSGNDVGFAEALYAALDEQGGPRPFDAVGVHPYAGDLSPAREAPGRSYEREPYGLYDENFVGFRRIHDVMSAHGDAALPVYLGEFGYSTQRHGRARAVPDALRADYLTEAFEAATCSDFVAALSWFYLHPTPWNPASWTLVDPGLRPNRTYAALRAWSTRVEGARR